MMLNSLYKMVIIGRYYPNGGIVRATCCDLPAAMPIPTPPLLVDSFCQYHQLYRSNQHSFGAFQ
jgi:hypothetical protein